MTWMNVQREVRLTSILAWFIHPVMLYVDLHITIYAYVQCLSHTYTYLYVYVYIYTHDVNRYMYTAYTYYHVLHINKISHNFTICTLQRSAQVFVSPP